MHGSPHIKVDPTPIVRAHWATLVDARTGRPHWSDWLFFAAVPGGALGFFVVWGAELGTQASAALLTISGLLGAFLFGVMIQIYARSYDLADSNPQPGRRLTEQVQNLAELAANAGYAALVCVGASVSYVAAIVSDGWVSRIFSALALAISTHLALVLLMVMRRLYFRTTDSLNSAQTGAAKKDEQKKAA